VEVRQRSQAVRVITGLMIFEVATLDIRHLTILGRQRDGDGQNKLLQLYMVVKIIRRTLSIV
jgi:hypothetical protein